jgi:hypothetical protein
VLAFFIIQPLKNLLHLSFGPVFLALKSLNLMVVETDVSPLS